MQAVEGRKMGSKATYPSLVNVATVCHSISVLSFHLSGHLLGQHHPTQIKRFRVLNSPTRTPV